MTTGMSTTTTMVTRAKDREEPADTACYGVRDTLELLR
jgi:hypothetical protein